MKLATTQWSLIVAAGGSRASEARSALAALCELYWVPVYAFIRRSGVPVDDAGDLTQAFFARVIEKGYFQEARRERGRFRTFLLTAVRHFLANERDAARALKRGGGAAHVPLEVDEGERQYRLEPAEEQTPEDLYDRRWALAVMDKAMARLAERYADPKRKRLFATLRPFLLGRESQSYAVAAASLGITEGALRVALHRLRQHFGESLRAVVAETVEQPQELDAELQHLLAIVSR